MQMKNSTENNEKKRGAECLRWEVGSILYCIVKLVVYTIGLFSPDLFSFYLLALKTVAKMEDVIALSNVFSCMCKSIFNFNIILIFNILIDRFITIYNEKYIFKFIECKKISIIWLIEIYIVTIFI